MTLWIVIIAVGIALYFLAQALSFNDIANMHARWNQPCTCGHERFDHEDDDGRSTVCFYKGITCNCIKFELKGTK